MLLENHTGTAVSISIRAVTFIEFFVSGLMIYMLSLLILFIAAPGKNGKLINIIFLVLITVHTLGLLIDQFTDFYYYFDEMNVYHRSRGYAMSNIMHILMLIQNVFLLIRYRNKINKKLASALWLYLLSPLAAIAVTLTT